MDNGVVANIEFVVHEVEVDNVMPLADENDFFHNMV